MGYYVAVPCKSAVARARLLEFAHKHFRAAAEFMDWLDASDTMPLPARGWEVCTYAKKNEVGWYRNAGWSDEESHYAKCFLRWAAMKVGRTMTTEDEQIPGYPAMTVHFTIYEGDPSPFVTKSQCPDAPDGWDAEGYEVCDDLGWDRSMRGPDPGEDPEWDAECPPYLLDLRRRKAKADPLIRAELERLEALWAEEE